MSKFIDHPCRGPVCKGRVTRHRFGGYAQMNGKKVSSWICTECEIPPDGKMISGLNIYDDEGNLVKEVRRDAGTDTT